MRLAYIVLAHRLPEQVARLVERLSAPDDLVLLHVDRRVQLAPFAAALGADRAQSKVQLLARSTCRWGGFGLVRATLTGLAVAVMADPAPDYICLLSGQDYPIRRRAEIESILNRAEKRAFLSHMRLPADGFPDGGGMDRLLRYYVRPSRRWSLPNRFVPFFPRRRLPAGFLPYGGKQFWCLPIDVARYVHCFVARNPEFTNFFLHSFIPDESFFQMIVMNGPYRERVVNDDLHHIEHFPGEAHPRVLTTADLHLLRESSACFARKFDREIDERLLDLIDTELLGRS